MRKYAIEIFFNKEFDEYVRNIWNICDDKKLSSFMKRVQGTEPHIALAVYEDVDQVKLEKKFKEFTQHNIFGLRLVFDAVAIFPVSMVTYFQPNTTKELIDLMIKVHDYFKEFEEQCNSFYSHDRWFPHTTIGKNYSLEEGLNTMNFVVKQFTPQIVQVQRLALVEIEYVDNEIYCRNLVIKELQMRD